MQLILVSLPYRFTLLSNVAMGEKDMTKFHYPIDLHYSQTYTLSGIKESVFHYPIDLHYSQTPQIRENDLLSL